MYRRLGIFLVAFSLLAVTAEASVEDFQKIHQQRERVFVRQMSQRIEKALPSASPEVEKIYRAIGYRPVWIDMDGMTHNAEMLRHELKDDFEHAAMLDLKKEYLALKSRIEAFFRAPSPEGRVEIELGTMQLYVDHIHEILRGSESEATPLSLLQLSLKKGSLVHAFNAVSAERIDKRISPIEENETILGKDIDLDENLTAKLREGSDRERLREMYRLLHFKPVWVSEKGYSKYTGELFDRIESDKIFDHNGPTYRKLLYLKSLPLPATKEEIVKREFEIAGLYQDFMGYLIYGAIDWKRFGRKLHRHYTHGVWMVHNVLISPELLLIESLRHGSLEYGFKKVKPKYPGEDRLEDALVRYRDISRAGGWPELPAFKDLKPGMSSPVVPLLRERLSVEGDYHPCSGIDEKSRRYDSCLLEAVKRFQARHGLEAEGYIGKKTRAALAESAMHKAARLRLSIARLKWLKRDRNRYHIVVNIPDFMVTVYDGWKPMEKMRVVTGRKGHETPVFYNKVRRIVLNPYWRIPPSIVRHETIPKLQKNPGYAGKAHIEIHREWSEHSPKIDPYSVNWHKYGKKLPPWHFMQSPGKKNALGKIKFLFPNPYSVYMHDTPEKALFSRDIRAFSHGCVRLHRPVDMLGLFVKMDEKIDFAKSKKILEKNVKTPLRLTHSIPIDIIYLTAWVDKEGTVQFREDIYGYDELQMETAKWFPRFRDDPVSGKN